MVYDRSIINCASSSSDYISACLIVSGSMVDGLVVVDKNREQGFPKEEITGSMISKR